MSLYKGVTNIPDLEALALLQEPMSPSLGLSNIGSKFLNTYDEWIRSTELNTITGLDNFSRQVYSQGTSEAFDKFLIRYSNRRIRFWRGEYVYHKVSSKTGLRWAFLDDGPVESGDAIILSIPFSDTGGEYKYHDTLLRSDELMAPVLVDCCYFGTCAQIEFVLDYASIVEVTFSLSKTFPLANHRIGIRYSLSYEEDVMFEYNKGGYLNYFSQHLGLKFLGTFSPDYIYKKYQDKQINLCKEINASPANTVLLGLSNDDKYSYLDRGRGEYRLCLSSHYNKQCDI